MPWRFTHSSDQRVTNSRYSANGIGNQVDLLISYGLFVKLANN